MRVSKFIEGEFYHVYNRGVSKQKIFHDQEDYERFRKLMYLANTNKRFKFRDDIERKKIDAYDYEKGESIVDVCFYVLMPNHFHICLFVSTKGVGAEKYMQKLEGGYTRYHNSKYKRSGTLFEGNYKSEHVSNDKYLKYLFSYIHLNPIKLIQPDWKEKGIKNLNFSRDYLSKYFFSSYKDYLLSNNTQSYKILNKEVFMKMLDKNFDLSKEIFTWLK